MIFHEGKVSMKIRYSNTRLSPGFLLFAFLFVLLTIPLLFLDVRPEYRLVLEASGFERYQVFYHTGPMGFSAPDAAMGATSVRKPEAGGVFYTLAFPIPDKPLNNIRIDPGDREGRILIRSIRIQATRLFTVHRWKAEEIVRDFKPWKDIGEFAERDGVLVIQSTGRDPYFLLPREQTQRIFEEIHSSVRWMVGIAKVLLLLFMALFLYFFHSGIDLLVRTLLDMVGFVLGRVFFFMRGLLNCRWIFGSRVEQVLLTVLFLTVIVLPVLDKQFLFFPQMESTEKRTLAKKPVLDVRRFFSFPDEYQAYFHDNFGLRNLLVRWNSLLQFKWLKISPHPMVVIGKHDWLFLGGKPTIDDYRGLLSYSMEELDFIQRRFDSDAAMLKSRGIQYLVVICPNKDTVYPEFMPDNITRVRETRRLDQLKRHLQDRGSQVRLVDLRDALINAKNRCPVYDKLGTHFNPFGGFVAYQEIMRELAVSFPGITPLTIDDHRIKVQTKPGANTDLTYFSAIVGALSDFDVSLVPTAESKTHKKIPKLLMYHDSFVWQLHPYLVHDFDDIILIHHDDAYINHETIQREKPDVVIYEVVERNLHALLSGPR